MLDNAIGLIGFTTVGVAYIYYTIWVLLTPFVEADNESFHSLFPDYYYAAVIPTAVLVACMLVVAVFAGCIFLRPVTISGGSACACCVCDCECCSHDVSWRRVRVSSLHESESDTESVSTFLTSNMNETPQTR